MSVIVITGCSTGIGYATAETLARNGHTVYATMRNPKASPQLDALTDADKLPITIFPMDVLDDESVKKVFDFVLADEGVIDVLVNNAGISYVGAVEETSMEFFKLVMDTNLYGTIRCIKAVLPSMRKRKSGTIINVSSVAGKLYGNFHGAYTASKAAVEALSESLAQEVKPYNIQVAIVEPGVIETPIFDKVNGISENTKYPNVKRYLSFFAASLEAHNPPSAVAEVINEIVAGPNSKLRWPAGADALGLLDWRSSISDEDWINSAGLSDEEWANNMEQMGLGVRKYLQAEGLPQLNAGERSKSRVGVSSTSR
ncbi:MAG: family NAD(P)-dependent oxidoreductase [Pedobacter sp.]|jgi:NAD(P)-dependent dehydrogenase (short-subunit alcohol dehydrogenase family)|nr:family NAD(P)-dependent oxidoreductase [Pedobacter sp.]